MKSDRFLTALLHLRPSDFRFQVQSLILISVKVKKRLLASIASIKGGGWVPVSSSCSLEKREEDVHGALQMT